MALDVNKKKDKKVDTSGLTSMIKKKTAPPVIQDQDDDEVNLENKESDTNQKKTPSYKAKAKTKTKSSSTVRTPFDDPSNEELQRVSNKISNQVAKNQLSPTRIAQLNMLRALADGDGVINKSQREIAAHLGYKDKKSLSKVIKYLCSKDKIKIIKAFDAKRQTSAVYRLVD